MRLLLTRDTFTDAETLGVIVCPGTTELDTLHFDTIERTVTDPVHPCVPDGVYILVLHNSPKHPHTFALVNIDLGVVHDPTPGKRSDILIHPANWARQLEGCIAPGKHRSQDESGWMVTHSREAYNELMLRLPWELGHILEIKTERESNE